ncbi:PREDICTED: granzyme A-like [Gekko japonicus]|uniref:Granzyme A-like n=1 Tax=Gekko japonicus TaxID=146911 RepID=A0ABM1KLJ6_GEKJA|nr:PREDICTED: granzyme A-like [Gekko japonicus]
MELSFVLYFSAAILLTGIPKGQCAGIIGGKESSPHSRPFMALIKGKDYCGGTLVKQSWVLTAAHCNLGSNPEIILGAHSSSKKEESQQIFKTAKLVPYPCFDWETLDNDIMLLQLNGTAKLNQYVKTIKLTNTYKDLKGGTQCLVAGWGITHNKDRKGSDTLQEANVTVFERSICNEKKHYNSKPVVTMNMVCAGDKKGKRDTCKGDSGGPLICNGEQRGITSFGKPSKCGTAQYPGVYARLTKTHLLWINKIIGGD